ncbi:MAG: hypothetical protein M1820_009010 [Bogoriella megaspora]|nr:MAG: hypothetical protein M1820_009010 [Bogoriella megaspora]
MSSLVLEPMTLEDFDIIEKLDVLEGDDLAAPGCGMTWPPSTAENNAYRKVWTTKQQRDILLQDSTVRYVKVVDTSKPERPIISIGRWHRYENGFSNEEHLPWELYGTGPVVTISETL